MEDPNFHAEQPEFHLVRVTAGQGKLLRVPAGYMLASEVREFLCLDMVQFRSLVQTGTLVSAKRDARGWRLYSEEEVKALAKKKMPYTVDEAEPLTGRRRSDLLLPATISSGTVYTKQEAVHVFGLIESGMSLVKIVMNTGLHSAVVQSIARDFYALEGGVYLSASFMGAINALALPGEMPIKNKEDLLAVLKAAAAEQLCKKCSKPRANHCASCLEGQVRLLAERRAKERAKEEALQAEMLAAGVTSPTRHRVGRTQKVSTSPMADDPSESAARP